MSLVTSELEGQCLTAIEVLSNDFALWIQRFEIYLSEAEIPETNMPLLDDVPFRIITQLGLVDSDNYGVLKEQLQKHYAKKEDDLERQY